MKRKKKTGEKKTISIIEKLDFSLNLVGFNLSGAQCKEKKNDDLKVAEGKRWREKIENKSADKRKKKERAKNVLRNVLLSKLQI